MQEATKDYYLKTNKENNYIKFYIKYNLGGYNWATGENMKRAFDLHIMPVEHRDVFESYMGFSGYRLQSEEIGRKSAKARENAVNYFIDNIDKIETIIDLIKKEQNFEIVEDYNLEKIIKEL